MKALAKRLQVLFSEKKYHALERIARAKKRSVGALIREAVDVCYLKPRRAVGGSRVARLAKMNLPVSDWKTMKEEIIAGALGKRRR